MQDILRILPNLVKTLHDSHATYLVNLALTTYYLFIVVAELLKSWIDLDCFQQSRLVLI